MSDAEPVGRAGIQRYGVVCRERVEMSSVNVPGFVRVVTRSPGLIVGVVLPDLDSGTSCVMTNR